MISYYFLVWIWLFAALPVFAILLKVTAPFGRHGTDKWGKTVANKWGWFIMELPALCLVPGFYILLRQDIGVEIFFVFLWCGHYFYRSCIFPFRLRTANKRIPVIIVAAAFSFNLINGSLCGYYFALPADYPPYYIFQINFVIGLALFCIGWLLNLSADNRLIGLRSPHEQGYKIPHGLLFRYVSCPNLLGEMIVWCAFAWMVWALPTTAFAVWTIANLLPRAMAHHRWYVEHFPDYPAERKAVIPFIL